MLPEETFKGLPPA